MMLRWAVRSDGRCGRTSRASHVVALALLFVAGLPGCARYEGIEEIYEKSSVMIPMRDGVRLYTEIYTPRDMNEPLPILFVRTPYEASAEDGGHAPYLLRAEDLANDRYVFAIQDARGRFKSEGEFEWNRPVRHVWDPEAVDASTDAYDSIEWLVTNIPDNNGRVGMFGVSYPGWYTTMALIDPHPALKAASPQASPSDYFMGDDFFHNGAFRLSPSVELPYLFDFDPRDNAKFPYDQVDAYEFFLDVGPLSNINDNYMHDASPTWNNFMAHATWDEYWRRGNTLQHLTAVTVPTLNVVGWWDAENLGGALDIYDTLEPLDQNGANWIVVGPWAHGQWYAKDRPHLGAYDFGSDTAAHFQQEIQVPWFAYFLKDRGTIELPEATMFQTGSNEWRSYDTWPPVDSTVEKPLYLHAGGALSFDAPDGGPSEAFESYISDPASPVPYTKRPIMGFWGGLEDSDDPRFGMAGALWKVEDQRFVDNRPDVLSWRTEILEEDVDVVGRITAHLFASTSGTDSDWVVKLIDVYPEEYPDKPEMGGYQLMIADDVLRGKFRSSFSHPEPLTPGEPTEFVIDLRTRNHRFRRGHRIMVQVQSTWFPLIGRNPQVFTDIPTASADDYRAAEQRVYFSRDLPSRVVLPVMPPTDE